MIYLLNLISNIFGVKEMSGSCFHSLENCVESHDGLSPESFLVKEVPENTEEYKVSKSHLLIESDLEHSLVSKKRARAVFIS